MVSRERGGKAVKWKLDYYENIAVGRLKVTDQFYCWLEFEKQGNKYFHSQRLRLLYIPIFWYLYSDEHAVQPHESGLEGFFLFEHDRNTPKEKDKKAQRTVDINPMLIDQYVNELHIVLVILFSAEGDQEIQSTE